MKEEKDINRLFRESIEQAPKGLSNSIMDKIVAEEKTDKTVMQMAGLDTPSEGFTLKVMSLATKNRYATHRLKINWTKWIWASAACFFIALVVWLGNENGNLGATSTIQIMPLLVKYQMTFIGILFLSLILLAEQLYQRAKLNSNL